MELDQKALAVQTWRDLEMTADVPRALEVACVTLPIEKVRALVAERRASLPSDDEVGRVCERLRYWIGNPSAWDAYDDGASELMRSAAALLQSQAAELAGVNKALERHKSDREYVIGWNDGFDHVVSVDLKFPTMLRKMWSGSEVQAWLDEQLAARRAHSKDGGEHV